MSIVSISIAAVSLLVFGALIPLSSACGQANRMRRHNTGVAIPEVDPGHAIRLREYVAAEEWEQAADELEALLRPNEQGWVLRDETSRDTGSFRRYVSAQEFAQQWLSVAPAPLLKLFQERINPTVERWWSDEANEREFLADRIVRHALFSDRGEEALLWLAATYQERGEFFAARALLERLTTTSRRTSSDDRFAGYVWGPTWLAWQNVATDERTLEQLRLLTEPAERLPVLARLPSPSTPEADVWARRVWLALQSGDIAQARVELNVLETFAPEAQGQLMGRQGRWSELLSALLEEREKEPVDTSQPESLDWAQIGHDLQRTNRTGQSWLQGPPNLAGEPAWSILLSHLESEGSQAPTRSTFSARSPSCFPIVVGGTVFVNQGRMVRALRLEEGHPQWPLETELDTNRARAGLVWEAEDFAPDKRALRNLSPMAVAGLSSTSDIVFARVESGPFHGAPRDPSETSQIIALNWANQARLVSGFPLTTGERRTEFSGCPISDGNSMYAVLRKSAADSPRVTLTLVSYQLVAGGTDVELQANWEQVLCESDSQLRLVDEQQTQEFVTLAEGVLYVNSNAGIVGAFDADSGSPIWLMEYPRAEVKSLARVERRMRMANPCVVSDDLVFVAPADTSEVLALDRITGALVWSRTLPGIDSLVAITDNHVIAGGNGIVWLGRYDGIEYTSFPRRVARGSASKADRLGPSGWGRALHAPPFVIWPTRDELFIFREAPRSVTGADRRTWYDPIVARRINLQVRQAQGGNLILANDCLLIAGSDTLWAFPIVDAGEPHEGELE